MRFGWKVETQNTVCSRHLRPVEARFIVCFHTFETIWDSCEAAAEPAQWGSLRLFSRFVVSGCYNSNTSDGCTFSSKTLSTSFSGFCRILVHNLPQNGCCKLPIVLTAFCKPVPVQFLRCMRQELALRFGSKMATNPWPPTVIIGHSPVGVEPASEFD